MILILCSTICDVYLYFMVYDTFDTIIKRQLFIFGISPSIPQDIFRKDRSSNYRPRARSDKRSFANIITSKTPKWGNVLVYRLKS
ncbi:unnamed protein product [Rhizophagus irregularis]|nr:unnamed protein product [Rhizophagus irregularis]